MPKHINNFCNLSVGDKITFTNKVGYKVEFIVSRIEEKSWYCEKGNRQSYGTLKSFMKYSDFKIEK